MAQGRDGVISQIAMKGPAVLWGDTRERLGKETEDKARAPSSHSDSRISAVCQGHSVIKLVVNGLKAARRGVRRTPCPEP